MKKRMTQTLLFILVVAIGLFYAIKYGNKAKKNIEKYEQATAAPEQNPYEELRNMAFSITPEQLGLEGIAKDNVYGIISDMDMGEWIATVITYASGDTSLYLSTGGGFIGAGQHESVQNVVKEFVKNGQGYLSKATKTEDTNLPKQGMVKFNFLTGNGVYSFSENLSELESGNSEFSKLFFELNEVITQIRLKSGE